MQFIIRDNGIDEIIVDIPEIDKQITEHYVLDFKEWIKDGPVNFVKGKPEARRIALASETKPMLKELGLPIPDNDYDICRWRFSQPEYKNRKQREDDAVFIREFVPQLINAANLEELETIYSSSEERRKTLITAQQQRIEEIKFSKQTEIEAEQVRALEYQAEKAQKEAELQAQIQEQEAQHQAAMQAAIDQAVAAALAKQGVTNEIPS